MKKFLISVAAIGLLAGAAAPAMAQPHRNDDRARMEYRSNLREGQQASARAADALARANRVLHSSRVSRREAAAIRSASQAVNRARNSYSSRGWEQWEINDLNRKTAQLNATVDRADDGRPGGRR